MGEPEAAQEGHKAVHVIDVPCCTHCEENARALAAAEHRIAELEGERDELSEKLDRLSRRTFDMSTELFKR